MSACMNRPVAVCCPGCIINRDLTSWAPVVQAMDSLQRAYHQELSNLSAERAAFAASLDAARRSTEAHPMDADRAKVRSRLCCCANPSAAKSVPAL